MVILHSIFDPPKRTCTPEPAGAAYARSPRCAAAVVPPLPGGEERPWPADGGDARLDLEARRAVRPLWALLFLIFSCGLTSAQPVVRLTGVVSLGPLRSALVEIQPEPWRVAVKPVLSVGERVEGVEVVSIDDRQGTISVKLAGAAPTTIALDRAQPTSPSIPRTLNLAGADFFQVLEVYQRLCGRTVLRDDGPWSRIDLQSDGVVSETEATKALEGAFNRRKWLAVPLADKFVVLTSGGLERVNALPPPVPAETTAEAEVLPPGMMKFSETHPAQVLDIYQELSGRTVLAAPGLYSRVTVKTQTSLTRAEAIWMLETALHLRGIRVVREGEKFAVVVPLNSKAAIPSVGKSRVTPISKGAMPPGMLAFRNTPVQAVLEMYAELCGRKVVPADEASGAALPRAEISVRSQTALTGAEALYALDTLAALQGAEFVPVGENQISVRAKTNVTRPPGPPATVGRGPQ